VDQGIGLPAHSGVSAAGTRSTWIPAIGCVVDAVALIPTQSAAAAIERPSRPAETTPARGAPMKVIQKTDIEVADATAQIERVHTNSFMEASLPGQERLW
jgi:hypothetical protein